MSPAFAQVPHAGTLSALVARSAVGVDRALLPEGNERALHIDAALGRRPHAVCGRFGGCRHVQRRPLRPHSRRLLPLLRTAERRYPPGR